MAVYLSEVDSEDEVQDLLYEVVSLWVTVRGFAMCSAWLDHYKQAKRRTTKKSKSLRKSIQTNTN